MTDVSVHWPAIEKDKIRTPCLVCEGDDMLVLSTGHGGWRVSCAKLGDFTSSHWTLYTFFLAIAVNRQSKRMVDHI